MELPSGQALSVELALGQGLMGWGLDGVPVLGQHGSVPWNEKRVIYISNDKSATQIQINTSICVMKETLHKIEKFKTCHFSSLNLVIV